MFIKLMVNCICAAIFIMTANVSEASIKLAVGVGGSPYFLCETGYWNYGRWIQGNCADDNYSPHFSGPPFLWWV